MYGRVGEEEECSCDVSAVKRDCAGRKRDNCWNAAADNDMELLKDVI